LSHFSAFIFLLTRTDLLYLHANGVNRIGISVQEPGRIGGHQYYSAHRVSNTIFRSMRLMMAVTLRKIPVVSYQITVINSLMFAFV